MGLGARVVLDLPQVDSLFFFFFGNGTIYRHDKKLKSRNKPNKSNKSSAEGSSEVRSAEGRRTLRPELSVRGLCFVGLDARIVRAVSVLWIREGESSVRFVFCGSGYESCRTVCVLWVWVRSHPCGLCFVSLDARVVRVVCVLWIWVQESSVRMQCRTGAESRAGYDECAEISEYYFVPQIRLRSDCKTRK